MNGAHFHLLVNHVPILGTLFGFILLFFGLLRSNKALKQAALITFVVAALFSVASKVSGEEAEEVVEAAYPDVNHKLIHKHEEIAEKATLGSMILGLLSLAGIYLIYKQRKQERLVLIIIIVVSGIIFGLMAEVGSTGGEISHSEIRADFKMPEHSEHDH